MSVINGVGTLLETVVGPRVLEIRKSGELGTEHKVSFRDIKTKGDTESQRLIFAFLREHFPEHSIRGEEDEQATAHQGTSEYEYIIDPIDGTTNYACGSPFFGISVGVAKAGVPYAGVIHYPAMSETIWAESGKGAFINGRPLVMRQYTGEKCELLMAGDLLPGSEHLFAPLKELAANVVMFACFTVTARFVAEGVFKLYVHTGATPFDICAAIAIVREAGGVAVGIVSDELDLSRGQIPIILACNRAIVEELRSRFANSARTVRV